MLNNKYDFTNKDDVSDQPSILKITSDQVQIIHAGGTNTEEIPEEGLVIQIGNIDSFIPPTIDPIDPDEPVDPTPTPTPDPDPDPVPDPDPDPTPTPSGDDHAPETIVYSTAEYTGGNGIKFVITNNTSSEARFTGKVILNIAKSPTDWSGYRQVNAHMHGPQSASSWDRNDIIIAAGGSYTSPEITTIDAADNGTTANFTDGTWYLMNSINNAYGYPIFLYTREYSRSRNAISGSQNMYAAAPTQNVKLQRGYTYYLNLYWKNPYASLDPDKSGARYIILAENQTNLLSN